MQPITRKLTAPMWLIMLGGLYWLWSNSLLNPELLIGLAACHVICTIIFYHFIYIFNYGYAVTMIVLPMFYGLSNTPSIESISVLLLVLLYGARLLGFTWRRYHSDSYAERAKRATEAGKRIPAPIKVITWLFTSSLMFFISFNSWIVASSEHAHTTIWPALAVMIAGLTIETVADNHKQRFKQSDKDALCQTGLYRTIRYPNYLGEIIFHLGLYWAMASATDQLYPLVLGSFGTGWIVLLMCDEAVTRDRVKRALTDNNDSFNEYWKKTGLLLPKLF
jgi:steroid 5-alpha reductase family enzyme